MNILQDNTSIQKIHIICFWWAVEVYKIEDFLVEEDEEGNADVALIIYMAQYLRRYRRLKIGFSELKKKCSMKWTSDKIKIIRIYLDGEEKSKFRYIVGKNGCFKIWLIFRHFHFPRLLYPRLISMLTTDRKMCKEGAGTADRRGWQVEDSP